MDIMMYFPAVLELFHNAVTCTTTNAALGCDAFWIIFYCIAMLVSYGAFSYALRYIYEQDAVKNNQKTQIKYTITNSKHIQEATLDPASFSNNISSQEFANRISKALYQL